jgi:ATP-binding cassette subfamily B protein
LGAIREVLLNNNQPFYVDAFRRADWSNRYAYATNAFLGSCPRYALEALGMILIAMLAYGLSLQPGGLKSSLPLLGAMALGAQRLLPALQQIFGAWAGILGSQADLVDALILIEQPLPEKLLLATPAPLDFQDEIQLNDVYFRYAQDGPWVLQDLNLRFSRGARVGLVGSTGCGKSTTMDLLMGLLIPISGLILVDGVPLDGENIRAWQRIIAHVPQNIFLADTTLAENIAFGEPLESIDMERVRQAAKQAKIAEFIECNPEGYNVLVGERGIRLSGGERQRIGIARALYKQAKVLVFDEATSALDNTTERDVMNAIEELGRDLTIIIIAHRLTTISRCDLIVELEHGKIVAQGTYEDLIARSPTFRKMVEIAGSE